MITIRNKIADRQEYCSFVKWYKDNEIELYRMYRDIGGSEDTDQFIQYLVNIWQEVKYKEYVIKN